MHEFTRARHRWPNSMNSARNCFPIQPDLVTISCFQTWRNSLEEKDSPPESSSSPKQTLILKSWTNRIIRTWKSSRIIGSSVSSWKETMLRNKNESIKKKNVFYHVFLKTYWLALVSFVSWRGSLVIVTFARKWFDTRSFHGYLLYWSNLF